MLDHSTVGTRDLERRSNGNTKYAFAFKLYWKRAAFQHG